MMTARAIIILLGLIELAFAVPARAQDDPACAQYQEPMAYNACLARHGPKANDVATRPAARQHGRAALGWVGGSEAGTPATGGPGWARATRARGRVHMEFPVE
jgi:hypothetical protein